MQHISWEDFEKVEMRIGTITEVAAFPQAHKPAYKLKIDLGELGIKQSSAQITKLYTREELLGKQVLCVTNFPPKQIANYISEVLVTGFPLGKGKIILAVADKPLPNGTILA